MGAAFSYFSSQREQIGRKGKRKWVQGIENPNQRKRIKLEVSLGADDADDEDSTLTDDETGGSSATGGEDPYIGKSVKEICGNGDTVGEDSFDEEIDNGGTDGQDSIIGKSVEELCGKRYEDSFDEEIGDTNGEDSFNVAAEETDFEESGAETTLTDDDDDQDVYDADESNTSITIQISNQAQTSNGQVLPVEDQVKKDWDQFQNGDAQNDAKCPDLSPLEQ